MFKIIVIAALAIIGVAAKKEDFPSFDMFHADCSIDATYPKDCGTIYTRMSQILVAYENKDPSNGTYKSIEKSEN